MREPTSDSRWPRLAPLIVGWLLVVESLVMFTVASFVAMIGGLMGGLAFLAGAGNATDEQIAEGFAMIGLTIVSPFLVASAIALAGVLLLFRKQRVLVVVACVFALLAQVVFHVFVEQGFHWLGLVPALLHVGAIGVAVAFVPRVSGIKRPRPQSAAR